MNSLHPEVQSGIGRCYKEACADASIKAVVITGGPGPFFMAGADIEYVHSLQTRKDTSVREVANYIGEGHEIFKQLESGVSLQSFACLSCKKRDGPSFRIVSRLFVSY